MKLPISPAVVVRNILFINEFDFQVFISVLHSFYDGVDMKCDVTSL